MPPGEPVRGEGAGALGLQLVVPEDPVGETSAMEQGGIRYARSGEVNIA
jgi:hypothetical protein